MFCLDLLEPVAPVAALVTARDSEVVMVTWTPASTNTNDVSDFIVF